MEPAEELKETIQLDMDEENELLFKVQIEGADAPATVRLVCEGDDLSFMFDGHPTEDEGVVQFLIPEMKNKIKEGVLHSKVEVLIGNKFFSPVQFGINFKQATKVFAEAVSVPQRTKPAGINVSAVPVIVARPRVKQQKTKVDVKPAIIESPRKSLKPSSSQPKSSLQERWEKRKKER